MTRPQITDAAELAHLDDAETVEGYFDGFAGEPEPGGNRSYAFWHGWTKGALDGGHRQGTPADAALAASYLESLRTGRLSAVMH